VSHPPSDVARALTDVATSINAHRTLEETLDAIVHAARVSVPGFDYVGISTVHGKDSIETRAATGQLVWDLDEVQYSLGEGPCYASLTDAPVVSAEHLRADQRWPRYVPEAIRRGVRSQLAYRLSSGDRMLGGLNFYSTRSDTFADGATAFGELFARHATVALGRSLTEHHLNLALSTRGLIGQAIGLTMAKFGISSDRAFQYLVRASSTSNIKLRDIAQEVVSQADAEATKS
jgi:GAF domain-containing protein